MFLIFQKPFVLFRKNPVKTLMYLKSILKQAQTPHHDHLYIIIFSSFYFVLLFRSVSHVSWRWRWKCQKNKIGEEVLVKTPILVLSSPFRIHQRLTCFSQMKSLQNVFFKTICLALWLTHLHNCQCCSFSDKRWDFEQWIYFLSLQTFLIWHSKISRSTSFSLTQALLHGGGTLWEEGPLGLSW